MLTSYYGRSTTFASCRSVLLLLAEKHLFSREDVIIAISQPVHPFNKPECALT